MCERLKQAVLKTAIPERVSGVRIPLPPPFQVLQSQSLRRLLNRARLRPIGRGGPAGGGYDYFCAAWSVLTGHVLVYADIVCSEVVTTFSSFRFSELSRPTDRKSTRLN